MREQTKWLFIFGLLCFSVLTAAAQEKDGGTLTAMAIVQRAIDNAGGDARLEAVKSAEFISQLIVGDKDTLSIVIKNKGYDKCYMSLMSFGYENTTTVFNAGKAVLIKNDTAAVLTDPKKLEELALRCYFSIDYGYKKLGYKLSRIEDLHDGNFNCYGVLAESPLGNKTANYYDMKTGNCTMIMYASGGRTIFTSFLPYRGIVYTRNEILGDAGGKFTRSYLTEINIDENPDDNWFVLPPAGDRKPPVSFKAGKFRYLNARDSLAIITRGENKQVESSKGSSTEYRIEWFSPSDYILYRLKNPSAAPTNENIEFIKTKITLWSGNKYYCHYLTSANQYGACGFERVE
jgi:hypothetical protein